jgi:hypothetical protein
VQAVTLNRQEKDLRAAHQRNSRPETKTSSPREIINSNSSSNNKSHRKIIRNQIRINRLRRKKKTITRRSLRNCWIKETRMMTWMILTPR